MRDDALKTVGQFVIEFDLQEFGIMLARPGVVFQKLILDIGQALEQPRGVGKLLQPGTKPFCGFLVLLEALIRHAGHRHAFAIVVGRQSLAFGKFIDRLLVRTGEEIGIGQVVADMGFVAL